MSYTKGPWFTGIDGERIGTDYRDENGNFAMSNMTRNGWLKVVCRITNAKWMKPGECEANAYLIAAAPELFELVKDLAYTFQDHPHLNHKRIAEIIAKAEGRESTRPQGQGDLKE